MKIFLSYPHTHKRVAASLANRLKAEGHDVFWDSTSLPPGESYDVKIRQSIIDSELFICLITKKSLTKGKYALSELKFAQDKWPNPSGNILPVALEQDVFTNMPAYLSAVTVIMPQGDVVAEIISEVSKIAGKPIKRIVNVFRIIGIIITIAIIGWFVVQGLPTNPIKLSVDMSGELFERKTQGRVISLSPKTNYLDKLTQANTGTFTDGEDLYGSLFSDKTTPLVPIIHLRLLNNSDETIISDLIRLEVDQSKLDLTPLFWSDIPTAPGPSSKINAIFNLGQNGWGTVQNCHFNFDIVPKSSLTKSMKASERRFYKRIKDLSNISQFDEPSDQSMTVIHLWEELSEFNADVTFLREGPHPYRGIEGYEEAYRQFEKDKTRLKALLGASPEEPIYAIGELSYTWGEDIPGKLFIFQEIQLKYPGKVVYPPVQIPREYDIELKPEGENYVIEHQIAHYIEPGMAEGIDLKTWCEKSSFHNMHVSVRANEEWISARDALDLTYYRPVGSISLEQAK